MALFSVANFFHRYYLAMLAPPLAALGGAGLVALWRDYVRPGWRGWLLPVVVLGTAGLHITILNDYPDWSARLAPAIAVLGVMVAGTLIVPRLRPSLAERLPQRALMATAALGLVVILAAPATWAGITAANAGAGMLPAAGPAGSFGGFGSPGIANAPDEEATATENTRRLRGGPGGEADPKVIAYLPQHHDGERFLFATVNAMSASPYILATGNAVAALGGFGGGDPILTTDQLAAAIADGEMRYFLVPSTDEEDQEDSSAAGGTNPAPPGDWGRFYRNDNVAWVNGHCTAVPRKEWQSDSSEQFGGFGGELVLFDCAAAA